MDRVKKLKVKKSDGTFTDYIPIGVDAQYVDLADGVTLEEKIKSLDDSIKNAVMIDEDGNVTLEGNLTVKGDITGNNISGGGSSTGIPISNVTEITATSLDEQGTVTWTDPNDVVIEGATLATWGGTKLVVKEGSYPTSPTDGTLVVDSKIKNQYKSTGCKVDGLTNGTLYYGSLFPYSEQGYVNKAEANRFTLEPGEIFPTVASNIQIAKDSNNLTFTVTFDIPADATKATVVMKQGSAPISSTDGIVKSNLTTGEATFTGIVKDVVYYFVVYTYNAKNRETHSSALNAKIASLEVVTFSAGTDEQIKAMLDAHYNGEIDIADYWAVGDTRKIHLNAITLNDGGSRNWAAQDITIVITAMKHHDLATPINGVTKAAITCQTRECINNNSAAYNENGHISWDMTRAYVTDNSKVHWTGIAMRTWANGDFYNTAMPTGTKNIIKPIKHNVLSTRGCSGTTSNGTAVKTTEEVTDKIFLPTYPEIYGNTAFNYYLSNSTPAGEEGTQWDYYKTSSNRIKYGNNGGAKNSTAQYWWMGSPSTAWYSSFGGYWCRVRSDGTANNITGNNALGFAPAFAM